MPENKEQAVKYLRQLDTDHGLPTGTLENLWNAESSQSLSSDTTSKRGAKGPFQFMPDTARELGVNPTDFKSAAKGAAKYLKTSMERFDGDVNKALASYNAGAHRVATTPFTQLPRETREYVKKINKGMESFSGKVPAIDANMAQSPLPKSGVAGSTQSALNANAEASLKRKEPVFGVKGDSVGRLYNEYKFGNQTFKTYDDLTKDTVDQLRDHAAEQGAYSTQNADEILTRQNLLKNKTLLDDFRAFHKADTGKELVGADGKPLDDNGVLDEYYKNMRWFDNNLAVSADRALKLRFNHYDPQTLSALGNMHRTWEKTQPALVADAHKIYDGFTGGDPLKFLASLIPHHAFGPDVAKKLDAYVPETQLESTKALPTIGAAQVTDPVNIAFMIQGLAGVAEKTVAHKAATSTVQRMVKEGLTKGFLAGTENAVGAAFQNTAEQTTRTQLGLQEKIDVGELGRSVGMAYAGGHVIGGGIAAYQARKPLGGFVNEFGRATAAQEAAKTRKTRVADIIEAEKQWTAGKEAAKDLHGPARAAWQAKVNEHWTDVIGGYMKNNLDGVHFKTDGVETPIKSVLTGEHLNNFMDKVGAKVTDDLPTVMDRVIAYTPSAADDLADTSGLKISGHSQRSAMVVALTNSLKSRMEEAAVNPTGDYDLHRLTRSWLAGKQEVTKLSSEAGWSLRLMQSVHDLGFSPEDYDLLSMNGKLEFSDKIARTLNDREATGITKRFGQTVKDPAFNAKVADWTKVLNNSAVLNMLGSLDTIVQNVVGGAHLGFDIAGKALGGVTSLNKKLLMDAGYQTEALLAHMDWKTGTREIINTFLDSKPHMTSSNFMNENVWKETGNIRLSEFKGGTWSEKFNSLGREIMGMNDSNPEGSTWKGTKYILSAAPKFVGERLLITSDELISQAAMRSYVWSEQMQMALREGMEVSAARDYATSSTKALLKQHVITNLNGEQDINPLLRKAVAYSDKIKFQQPLEKGFDIGAVGRVFDKLKNPDILGAATPSQAIARGMQSVIATAVAPFVKTPANILNYGFAHTPVLSLLSKDFRRTMATGSDEEKATATGALALGAILWGLSAVSFFNGDLHGHGAMDANQAAIARANGRDPEMVDDSSLALNDISRLLPFTFHKAVLGEISDMYRYGGPEALEQGIAALAMYSARSLLDTPGLTAIRETAKSVNDIMGGFENEDKWVKGGKNFAKTAVNYIPGSKLIKQSVDTLDNADGFTKDAVDFLQAMQVNMIGTNAKELGYKRDPFSGVKIIHETKTGAAMWEKYHKTKAIDEVNNEIINQGVDVGPISPSLKGVDLRAYHNKASGTPWYDRLQELVMEVKPEGAVRYGGLNLYDALQETFKSEEYKAQSVLNRQKTRLSTGAVVFGHNTKKDMIKNVLMDYRNLAYEKVEAEIREAASKGDPDAIMLLEDYQKKANVGLNLLQR